MVFIHEKHSTDQCFASLKYLLFSILLSKIRFELFLYSNCCITIVSLHDWYPVCPHRSWSLPWWSPVSWPLRPWWTTCGGGQRGSQWWSSGRGRWGWPLPGWRPRQGGRTVSRCTRRRRRRWVLAGTFIQYLDGKEERGKHILPNRAILIQLQNWSKSVRTCNKLCWWKRTTFIKHSSIYRCLISPTMIKWKLW